MDYREGSIIEYISTGGDRRVVLVEEREEEIKNGRPGFDGILLDPSTLLPVSTEGGSDGVWGYDAQIVRVIRY